MRPYSRVLSSTIVIFGLLTAAGCFAAVPTATQPPVPTPTLATAINQDKAIEIAIGDAGFPTLFKARAVRKSGSQVSWVRKWRVRQGRFCSARDNIFRAD